MKTNVWSGRMGVRGTILVIEPGDRYEVDKLPNLMIHRVMTAAGDVLEFADGVDSNQHIVAMESTGKRSKCPTCGRPADLVSDVGQCPSCLTVAGPGE